MFDISFSEIIKIILFFLSGFVLLLLIIRPLLLWYFNLYKIASLLEDILETLTSKKKSGETDETIKPL